MSGLRKCVIPAAGLGTRLLPLTGTRPKEMVEVGGRPVIDWVIEEAVASGLAEICLIISPVKKEMKAHVRKLLSSSSAASLCCLEQERPSGLARAISLAEDSVGDEPFALILPDNLVREGKLLAFHARAEVFDVGNREGLRFARRYFRHE